MSDALAVFARYPRKGEVKTRLAGVVGEGRALELHGAFLLDTLDRVLRSQAQVFLFLADASGAEALLFRRQHRLSKRLRIRTQQGKDLGERMWNACLELDSLGFSSVVFVGSDTPNLPLEFVERAFGSLAAGSVAVGPVEDGGYYLLGLGRPRKELFVDVDWGTERVLEQTVSRLRPGEIQILPLWYDVDVLEDLRRLWTDIREATQAPPRTTALLREWSLESSILTGVCPGDSREPESG